MSERPNLDMKLDSKTFKEYYYLKEELINFCRNNGLQSTGEKLELTERIANYLDKGEKTYKIHNSRKTKIIDEITLDTIIEKDFIFSEKHRKFYKEHIGNSFSFNVVFQKWLKSNAGKTYQNSIDAYYKILEEKKKKSIKFLLQIFDKLFVNSLKLVKQNLLIFLTIYLQKNKNIVLFI